MIYEVHVFAITQTQQRHGKGTLKNTKHQIQTAFWPHRFLIYYRAPTKRGIEHHNVIPH